MEQQFEYSTVENRLFVEAAKKKIPINGGIELTPLCNMNCEMCYVRLEKKAVDVQGGLRSVEEWMDIACQMKEAGVLFLLLTGGEPLTYPGFKELYMGLQNLGMIIAINTNGTLIDEEWASFFGENKPRRINITLYGKNNQTYRELCHYADGYDRTIRGIKLLQKYGVDVKMNCSIAKNNADDMEELIAISHELDIPITIDTYMVAATRERELPYIEQSRLNPKDAAAARIRALKAKMTEEEFDRYAKDMLFRAYNIGIKRCQGNLGVSCYAGKCSFMLTWKGIMKPCVIMEGIEADVFEVGFENAWEHIVEGTQAVRINLRCAMCHNRPVCRNCVACAMAETGTYDGVSEYVCAYAAESMRIIKEEYAE